MKASPHQKSNKTKTNNYICPNDINHYSINYSEQTLSSCHMSQLEIQMWANQNQANGEERHLSNSDKHILD